MTPKTIQSNINPCLHVPHFNNPFLLRRKNENEARERKGRQQPSKGTQKGRCLIARDGPVN